MKISFLMMQKNEDVLLKLWATYHGELFGYQNLHILDNGSTLSSVVGELKNLEDKGAHVERRHSTVADFARKGELIAARIQFLDANDPSDFYFPVDCDELVMAGLGGQTFGCGPAAMERILRPHLSSPHVLTVGSGYDNFPGEAGGFCLRTREKSFFAQGACAALDIGFHRGLARASTQRVETGVSYVHLHNKPFEALQLHAKQKMIGRVAGFDRETLLAHRAARGNGMHLIDELLFSSEADYLQFIEQKYEKSEKIKLVALEQTLRTMNMALPY